jgi:hypothetical protein
LFRGKRGWVNSDTIASFEDREKELVCDDEEDCEDDLEDEESDSKDNLDINF